MGQGFFGELPYKHKWEVKKNLLTMALNPFILLYLFPHNNAFCIDE